LSSGTPRRARDSERGAGRDAVEHLLPGVRADRQRRRGHPVGRVGGGGRAVAAAAGDQPVLGHPHPHRRRVEHLPPLHTSLRCAGQLAGATRTAKLSAGNTGRSSRRNTLKPIQTTYCCIQRMKPPPRNKRRNRARNEMTHNRRGRSVFWRDAAFLS
jgi:hypothetical protein